MSEEINKNVKLPLNKNILLIKSFFLSLYFHIWLFRNDFSKYKSLHNLQEEDIKHDYSKEQKLKIKQISIAIQRIEKLAPWKPKCYNLALLARKLLKNNKIPNVLKIGFRKRNNRIEGHAWVKCNQIVVSGYLEDLRTYKPLKPVDH